MFKIFIPPAFQDTESTRLARIFFNLLVGSAAIITILELLDWYLLPQNYLRWLFILGVYDITCLGVLVLNRKGHIRLAAYIFIGFVLALCFGLAWSSGGMQSRAVESFPIVVLFAGLILGWKRGLITAMITVLCGLGLVAAEHYGLLPVSAIHPTSLGYWQTSVVTIGLLALLQYVTVANLNKALRDSQQELIHRKIAEEELRSSETQFRDLWKATVEGIAIHDKSIIVEVNEALCRMAGYAREQIIGKSLFDFTPVEMHERISKGLASGTDGYFEIPALRADGVRIMLEVFAKAIHFRGKPMRMIALRDITERKQAEEALRESEERYKQLINISPDLIAIHQDGRAIFINEEGVKLLGAQRADQILGRLVSDFIPPAYRELSQKRIEETIVDRKHPKRFEQKLLRLDGVELDIEVDGMLFAHENRPAIQFIARDITERKRAEQERQAMYEIVEGVTTTTNLDELLKLVHRSIGRVLYAENFFVALYDSNTRLFTFPYFVDKYDSAPQPAALAKSCTSYVFRTGKPHLIPQAAFDRLKEQNEVDLVGSPSPSWIGVPLQTPSQTIGVLVLQHYEKENVYSERDLTFLASIGGGVALVIERKKAEAELRENESRLRRAQAMAHVGNWEFDLQTRQMWGSEEAFRIYGMESISSYMPMHTVQQIVLPEYRPQLDAGLQDIINTGKAYDEEFQIRRQNDGLVRYIHSNAELRLDSSGKPAKVVGVLQDITERRHAEEALRHAQKLEGIGTLAGGIAHDFNNLLNAMLGQSTLAIGKLAKESPAKNHIEKSIKAAEKAADLTKQLLAYSGKGQFLVEEVDLNRLVQENAELLELSVPKTTQLRYELDPAGLYIRGDVGQLQQIIMNLIINAGEAMGKNPGLITICTKHIELAENDTEYWKYTNTPLQAGTYASLQVNDTGHGMKPEVLSRIFDPFFTTKFTGRGLGLAAVLGIVRGHKGGVRIESSEGKGTEFDIIFPLLHVDKIPEHQEMKEPPAIKGDGKTILVIDDEPTVLELLKDILTEANFKVIGALNPLDGIELYRRHKQRVAIVVLDYSMPGMDGKAAFEELIKINKEVKVLLCSGYTEEEIKSAFADSHPYGFIKKPYKPSDFLVQVSNMLLA